MRIVTALVLLASLATAPFASAAELEPGFVSLFDGKTFNGWKVGKNADSFAIRDGMIVVNGLVAHLFYDGPVANHEFKNFHFKAEVMTFPHSNSGIYFHTRFQEEGFPKLGIECQVNNSHKDWRRTGSLWGLQNVTDETPKATKEPYTKLDKWPVKDEAWFTQEIIVRGLHVEVLLDGVKVLDYTFPAIAANAEYQLPTKMTYLPQGTFALQGHDPGSKVYFKNLRVKILD